MENMKTVEYCKSILENIVKNKRKWFAVLSELPENVIMNTYSDDPDFNCFVWAENNVLGVSLEGYFTLPQLVEFEKIMKCKANVTAQPIKTGSDERMLVIFRFTKKLSLF